MIRSIRVSLFALAAIAACTPQPAAPPSPSPRPTGVPTPPPAPTAVPSPTIEPIFVETETLDILQSVAIPMADPEDLARRLKGVTAEIPETLEPPASPRLPGARDTFWITNGEDEQVQVSATLNFVTEHAYFWVQDEVQYEQADLETLADRFENGIYGTNRSFFGTEWSPGIDGDPHIYILYARRLGIDIAGYFSSVDSLHPLVRETSNAHEMFVFNADNVDLADEFTYGVLAHEFQHMIHWNVDIDEVLWLNEGFSELAVYLNRLGTAGFHTFYTDDPVASLNDWPNQEDSAIANYGAASLFTLYFYNRFGPELTKAFVANPANGLDGIDVVFAESALIDPVTEEPVTVESTVLDWAIANYLSDVQVLDGRFGYPGFPDFRPARQTVTLVECEPGPEERQVNQFAPNYIRMICPGQYTLAFDGAEQTRLLNTEPHSGEYSFWSNKADHADMRLSQSFDLTAISAPITLSYWTWYDIERDWDFVYLLASEDNESWEFIQTPNGTDRNPTGSNYGWGYTGITRGLEWIEETVDLSAFAGKQVTLRFEYVEDAGVNGEGMLLDDISIPAVGYSTDFEQDDGGWTAEGWVRVKNVLPQTFRLALITFGDPTTVEYIPVGVNNTAEISMDIGEDGPAQALVIVPTTRYTRQPASYTLSFSD
ncbi:MAG: hypothetical protein ACRDHG_00990 [Anaerolineales bacterium]